MIRAALNALSATEFLGDFFGWHRRPAGRSGPSSGLDHRCRNCAKRDCAPALSIAGWVDVPREIKEKTEPRVTCQHAEDNEKVAHGEILENSRTETRHSAGSGASEHYARRSGRQNHPICQSEQ